MEKLLQILEQKIENLKIQYNLFFSGEINIPPEKEREELEKDIREILYAGQKSPRITLLVQNLASKFTLYNNMWLKKLHDVEVGVVSIKKRKLVSTVDERDKERKRYSLEVSLNNEESFENFFNKYCELAKLKKTSTTDKENIINSLKSKMISENMIDVKVNLSVTKGKLKIKIKN
jgi:lipopolysaccharide biosynthesis glycosyltransferase